MNEQDAAKIGEIAGILATAIVAMAVHTAKTCSTEPGAYLDGLIDAYSGLDGPDRSPAQRVLLRNMTEGLETASAVVRR